MPAVRHRCAFLHLLGVLPLTVGAASCTEPEEVISNSDPVPSAGASDTASLTTTPPESGGVLDQNPERAEVVLYHCGVVPIVFNDVLWEVPEGTSFDATNAPAEFVGEGTVTLSPTGAELIYADDAGLTLTFVPDDGSDPMCA
ncbi:MAG: hypothetical protein H0W25_13090 [Acidimicrobiia bacterium]|nr:hypothetical protein [Acidimicrobiia bacterium]